MTDKAWIILFLALLAFAIYLGIEKSREDKNVDSHETRQERIEGKIDMQGSGPYRY